MTGRKIHTGKWKPSRKRTLSFSIERKEEGWHHCQSDQIDYTVIFFQIKPIFKKRQACVITIPLYVCTSDYRTVRDVPLDILRLHEC